MGKGSIEFTSETVDHLLLRVNKPSVILVSGHFSLISHWSRVPLVKIKIKVDKMLDGSGMNLGF
jgi:hypothetical protein